MKDTRECRNRARISVWWPGISKQLEQFIQKCPVLQEFSDYYRASDHYRITLKAVGEIASDLYELTYILVVDSFSRFIETQKLNSTTSSNIIVILKSICPGHGIPDTVVTDNGPQYFSNEFQSFVESYSLSHITSSLYYPRGNGEAERPVRTLKNLLTL